jgi:hypothetical protein
LVRVLLELGATVSLPIVALSGEEVAFALLRVGFSLRARDEHALVLERGLRRVAVPVVPRLEPAVLLALLHDAGVSYTQIVEVLDAVHALPNTSESHVRVRQDRRSDRAKSSR